MSKKRRRRDRARSAAKPRPSKPAEAKRPAAPEAKEPPPSDRGAAAARAAPARDETASGRPRRTGLFGARLREESPFPSFRESAGAGLRAAASSPVVVAAAALTVLALWGAFVGMGLTDVLTPKTMVNMLSLPPVYVLFLDGFVAFAPVFGSPLYGLVAALVLGAVRLLVLGAFAAVVARRLGWRDEAPLQAWRRAVPHLLLISLLFFGVAAAVPYLVAGFLGAGLGPLLGLLGPVLGLHFLVFAPISAVLDGAGYRDAVRRGARAARFPGGSHLVSTFGYFALTLLLVSVVPQPLVPPVTPSILTWALTLLATFLHVAVLAGFTYRWLAVRDHVPSSAERA